MNHTQISTLAQNQDVLKYLGQGKRFTDSTSTMKRHLGCSPDLVANPYLDLGTHPELVKFLWKDITRLIDVDCRWIIFGTPALVNPQSSLVFAFAEGTQICALRVPPQKYSEALLAGATKVVKYPAYPYLNIRASEVDASSIGSDWLFVGGIKNEALWGISAHDYSRVHNY